jgi:hypothetical protein
MNKIIDRTGIYIPQTKGWNWSIRVEGNALLSLDGSNIEDRCFKQVSRGEISNPSHRVLWSWVYRSRWI